MYDKIIGTQISVDGQYKDGRSFNSLTTKISGYERIFNDFSKGTNLYSGSGVRVIFNDVSGLVDKPYVELDITAYALNRECEKYRYTGGALNLNERNRKSLTEKYAAMQKLDDRQEQERLSRKTRHDQRINDYGSFFGTIANIFD